MPTTFGSLLRRLLTPQLHEVTFGKRARELRLGPGRAHIFLTYIGIGFAMARLPRVLWKKVVSDLSGRLRVRSRLLRHPALGAATLGDLSIDDAVALADGTACLHEPDFSQIA